MALAAVYLIINIESQKRYVGSSLDVRERFRTHFRQLASGKHPNPLLQYSYNKHGINAFRVSLLEIVTDLLLIREREQHFIDSLNTVQPNGFNVRPKADNWLGHKHTEESKRKMSAAKKGWIHSPEAIAKQSAAKRGKKRKPFSEEWKRKISTTMKGVPCPQRAVPQTEEMRRRHSEQMKGRRFTAEHKQKISEARKAYWSRTNRDNPQ